MNWIVPMVLVAALGLSGCASERSITMEDFRDRMKGAWIGQSVGVAYGAPTEFKHSGELVPEDKMPQWTPETVNGTFWQDDLYV